MEGHLDAFDDTTIL